MDKNWVGEDKCSFLFCFFGVLCCFVICDLVELWLMVLIWISWYYLWFMRFSKVIGDNNLKIVRIKIYVCYWLILVFCELWIEDIRMYKKLKVWGGVIGLFVVVFGVMIIVFLMW